MISCSEQGTEPPPPPPGVTGVPTLTSRSGRGCSWGRVAEPDLKCFVSTWERLCVLPPSWQGWQASRGGVLEAELLPAVVLKGRRVWSCPVHPSRGVGVRGGRVSSGHGEAAQPCCSGFPCCVLLLGTS